MYQGVECRGAAVADALVAVKHANSDGCVETGQFRARICTDLLGEFPIVTIFARYVFGLPHILRKSSHPDHGALVTRMFFKRGPAIKRHDPQVIVVVLEDSQLNERPRLCWIPQSSRCCLDVGLVPGARRNPATGLAGSASYPQVAAAGTSS